LKEQMNRTGPGGMVYMVFLHRTQWMVWILWVPPWLRKPPWWYVTYYQTKNSAPGLVLLKNSATWDSSIVHQCLLSLWRCGFPGWEDMYLTVSMV
jgi:hypothetical protein